MFENCNFNINLDTKDLDVKTPINFKKCFDNSGELIPISSLEQIIEELWDKEPNIEKLSAKKVIEKCREKGLTLNLYSIIKIHEDFKGE